MSNKVSNVDREKTQLDKTTPLNYIMPKTKKICIFLKSPFLSLSSDNRDDDYSGDNNVLKKGINKVHHYYYTTNK